MFTEATEADFIAPTLADAHRDWHNVNGAYAVCPLDCGAMSPEQAAAEAEAEAVWAFTTWATEQGFAIREGAYGRTYAVNARGVVIAAGPVVA